MVTNYNSTLLPFKQWLFLNASALWNFYCSLINPHARHFLDISFCFQELYRTLLKAESDGILDGIDMTKVEKLILDPERKEE